MCEIHKRVCDFHDLSMVKLLAKVQVAGKSVVFAGFCGKRQENIVPGDL